MKTIKFAVQSGQFNDRKEYCAEEDFIIFETLSTALPLFIKKCDMVSDGEFTVGTADKGWAHLYAVEVDQDNLPEDSLCLIEYTTNCLEVLYAWDSATDELEVGGNIVYHYHIDGKFEINGKNYDRYEVKNNA